MENNPNQVATNQLTPQPLEQNELPIKITITLPTNAYFMSGIRDFTLSLIKNTTDFSEQWAYRFQSVVDELCNNAIEYGSAPHNEIKITFLSIPHKTIEISVEDTGTGKNPIKAEELTALIEERKNPNYILQGIRGRGLAKIVSEWTDELLFEDVNTGGIKVTVKKHLNDPKFQQETAGFKAAQNPNQLILQ